MKLFQLAAIAASLAIAMPTYAADTDMAGNMAEDMSHDFSGPYVGVAVGGQYMAAQSSGANFIQPNGTGLMAQVFAGLNMQQDDFLFGVEADIGYGTAAGSTDCFNPAFTCSTYLNVQGSARARLGYVVDDLLLYATGGLAIANYGGSTLVKATSTEFPDSGTRIGYTVGGGGELALGDGLLGRVEYRYANYGSRDMNYDVTYTDVDVSTHTVSFGLAMQF